MATLVKQYGSCKVEYSDGKPIIKGIPRRSLLSISALPHRREVVNTQASGSYTPSQLDPGKYVFTVLKPSLHNNPHVVWSSMGEFLVDVTEAEYQRLIFIRPRFCKGVMTSDGARWTCEVTGCSDVFTSMIAAVQHEGEHLGVDFIHASIDEAEEAIQKAAQTITKKAAVPSVDVNPLLGGPTRSDVTSR